ncbi:MAG TPA: hypothetical protein VFQ54_12985, partial [Thermomicrobiales bacterium]|nr:hypothetical protein [Thermomicrobiales bacterium]
MNARNHDQIEGYLLTDDEQRIAARTVPIGAPPVREAVDDHAAEILQIERARRDPIDFAPLYERYVDAVHGYCARRVTDPELAADLT